MNITPHIPTIPIATTTNPATETLRRDNNIREVITQPAATAQSAAEKGVGSEKDRSKTPAQNNEQFDFSALRKRAEDEATTISDDSDRGQGEKPPSDTPDENAQTEQKSKEAFADEQKIIELKQRDAEVRTHESAHSASGGATTGAPSYSFEVGPDGKKYAVSGEVSVDLSKVNGDPLATIAKMQKVHTAALAPAQPSVQDMRVADSATKNIIQAQSELLSIDKEGVREENAKAEALKNIQPDDELNIEDRSSLLSSELKTKLNYELGLEQNEALSSNEFDTFINNTLKAQEDVSPSRSADVSNRAVRIESFYSNINQAYEKSPRHQFELLA